MSTVLIQTEIADMNPQDIPLLLERLREAGATNAWVTPVITFSGLPANQINIVIPEMARQAIADTLMDNSSATEFRELAMTRHQAGHAWESMATRWGDVRVELKIWRGRVLDAFPSHADCVAIARDSGAPLRLVYGEAKRMSDVFIGRRWADDEQMSGRV